MKSVLREVVARRQRPFWQIMIIIIASVIFVNSVITLCNMLGEKYAGIASVIVLLIAIAVCSVIIFRLLSSYTYTLDDDELIFNKVVGRRETFILKLKLHDIIYIKPYKEVEKNKEIAYTYKFVCEKDYDNFYIGEFERENKLYRFIIKPSDRLLRIVDKNQ